MHSFASDALIARRQESSVSSDTDTSVGAEGPRDREKDVMLHWERSIRDRRGAGDQAGPDGDEVVEEDANWEDDEEDAWAEAKGRCG